MDDAGAMRFVECVGDLNRNRQRLIQRQRALRQPIRQRLPFEVLQDQKISPVLVADVVQRADVRMVQRRDRACLALKAFAQRRVIADVCR